jgi:hypothetical protein
MDYDIGVGAPLKKGTFPAAGKLQGVSKILWLYIQEYIFYTR